MLPEVAEKTLARLPRWAVTGLVIAGASYLGLLGWSLASRIVGLQVGPLTVWLH